MRRSLPLACALTLLLTPLAMAQQPRDYALLRDSLASESDILDLRGRARSLGAPSPDALTERGFVLLRLFELTHSEDDVKLARETFEDATQAAPASAWAHYGLGLAFARSPEIRVRGPLGILSNVTVAHDVAEILGRDPESRARRALFRAVELDPTLSAAALELAGLALASREPQALEEARAALAIVRGTGGPAAAEQVVAAVADVESALDNPARAEGAAREALGRAGADSAIVLRSLAEALLRQPGREGEGAVAYFEGAARMGEVSAAHFYSDVELIATPNEQLRWKTADLEGRRAWLRTFWSNRAALSGVTTPDRIAEHYRRLARALSEFRRQRERGAPPADALLFESTAERHPFDDRGLVYIRYGEPDRVIRTSGTGVRPNETWVYGTPGGELQIFHLVVLAGGQDYVLVDDVFAIADPLHPDIESLYGVLEDRAGLDPQYMIFANQLREAETATMGQNATGASSQAMVQRLLSDMERENLRVRQRARADMLEALEHDAAYPRFQTDIPFYYDLYTFRGDRGRTDLTAAFAVPGNYLRGRPLGEHTYYALEISVILVDTVADLVTRRDSVYEFRSLKPLEAGEYARFHIDLDAAPAGKAVHRVLIRNAFVPTSGQLYGGPARLTDYHQPGLRVSEIVLAEADSTGAWKRGRASLQLLPPRRFRGGEPFTLFYEVYGLPQDAPYETRITVEPTEGGGLWNGIKKLFGGGGPPVRLSFSETARPDARGHVQEIRRVAGNLDAGRYRIRITVRHLETGESVEVERLFLVIED